MEVQLKVRIPLVFVLFLHLYCFVNEQSKLTLGIHCSALYVSVVCFFKETKIVFNCSISYHHLIGW